MSLFVFCFFVFLVSIFFIYSFFLPESQKNFSEILYLLALVFGISLPSLSLRLFIQQCNKN